MATSPAWLLSPELGESRWLTPSVHAAMREHLRWAKQTDSQEAIDGELLKWAARAYGGKPEDHLSKLPELQNQLSTNLPSRYGDMLTPLAQQNAYAHIPPATMVAHSNSTVIPYIVNFPDGGRLILIDPLNHVLFTSICCALLISACYDLDEEQLEKLLDFVTVTAAYYSADRSTTESLLNHGIWHDLSQKLMHVDGQIQSIAEKLSFNILCFAFYHEVSHSLLGHIGSESAREVRVYDLAIDGRYYSWRQQQELEADALGCRFFLELLRGSNAPNWTGGSYDHAPLIFFRLWSFFDSVRNRLDCDSIDSSSHPAPLDRLSMASGTLNSLSEDGRLVYTRMCSGLERVEAALSKKDLKQYLRNAHLLTNHGIIRP